MDGACARAAGGGGSWWCLLVRGAPLASYGLVAHFPSCSPVVVVVVVVAHVFEQRLTRLAYVLVRVCLRVRCLSVLRERERDCSWQDTTYLVRELHLAQTCGSTSGSTRSSTVLNGGSARAPPTPDTGYDTTHWFGSDDSEDQAVGRNLQSFSPRRN